MKKKIILTSIVSLCFAMPAMAEFTAGQQIADENGLLNGMACDSDTLGVTQDTANLEAIWTPNTYSISYTCQNGEHPQFMVPYIKNGPNCTSTSTDPRCIYEKHAIYGEQFTFASYAMGCEEPGYTTTGWSCTRDTVANDTPTVYALGQQLQAWNINSDLTCTEVREGNTITLDWYNSEQATTPSSTTQCTYGVTSGQGALSLPSQPTAPAGYTFGGWKMIENVCERLETQTSCNNSGLCFWYVDGNTNTGSCMNVSIAQQTCYDARGAAHASECQSIGYCISESEVGLCYSNPCVQMDSTTCASRGEWDEETGTCYCTGTSMLDQNQQTTGNLSLLG